MKASGFYSEVCVHRSDHPACRSGPQRVSARIDHRLSAVLAPVCDQSERPFQHWIRRPDSLAARTAAGIRVASRPAARIGAVALQLNEMAVCAPSQTGVPRIGQLTPAFLLAADLFFPGPSADLRH
jgi:hypothetical protein